MIEILIRLHLHIQINLIIQPVIQILFINDAIMPRMFEK